MTIACIVLACDNEWNGAWLLGGVIEVIGLMGSFRLNINVVLSGRREVGRVLTTWD